MPKETEVADVENDSVIAYFEDLVTSKMKGKRRGGRMLPRNVKMLIQKYKTKIFTPISELE